MTVERTHTSHETQYALRDGGALRCILVFDAGEDGGGPAAWKILLPGPDGTEDLYGAREIVRPNAAEITAWLTPMVGADAAAELARAVDASPPRAAGWPHGADG
jgi:hypothetical protein